MTLDEWWERLLRQFVTNWFVENEYDLQGCTQEQLLVDLDGMDLDTIVTWMELKDTNEFYAIAGEPNKENS